MISAEKSKATEKPRLKKSLKQIVYPGHKDSYSGSMRVSTEDLNVGNGRVCVFGKVKYVDGAGVWLRNFYVRDGAELLKSGYLDCRPGGFACVHLPSNSQRRVNY